MRNPFAKPHTPGQWLLSSVCWTASCISLWWIIIERVSSLKTYSPEIIDLLSFVVFWPFCLLIWSKGVMHGNMWVWSMSSKAWFRMLSGAWLALLIVFQIIITMLGIAGTILSCGALSANNQVFFP
jgi:hypothetical protein